MVSITKYFTDLTFEKKLSEVLLKNNFDENNVKKEVVQLHGNRLILQFKQTRLVII